MAFWQRACRSCNIYIQVLAFMYTERLDVGIEDVDAVLRVARRCRLGAFVAAASEELRTLKYYFKSTRRDDTSPRRRVLFGSSVLNLGF